MWRLRKSKWEFDNSVGSGVAVGVAGGENGQLIVKDSRQIKHTFNYAHGTAGPNAGIKGMDIGFSYSNEDPQFLSTGRIYMLDSFKGQELNPADFLGGYVIFAASAALSTGLNGNLMIFGVPHEKMQNEVIVSAVAAGLSQAGGPAADIVLNEGKVGVVAVVAALMGGVAGKTLKDNAKAVAALFESNAKGVLISGGTNAGLQIGAGVGAGIGFLWQGEEPKVEVRKRVLKEVVPRRTHIVCQSMRFPVEVLFGFDKAVLKDKGVLELVSAAQRIRALGVRRVVVEGHTDSVGGASYNIGLSQRRADAAITFLKGMMPFDPPIFESSAIGERRPIATNDTEAGREQNRRIELHFYC